MIRKEATCKLQDGKPVVLYKDEYYPRKGDVVISGFVDTDNIPQDRHMIAICNSAIGTEYYFKYAVSICPSNNTANFEDCEKSPKCVSCNYTRKATKEEAEVMHYFLKQNGLELVNGKVRKIKWVPQHGELYYVVRGQCGEFYAGVVRHDVKKLTCEILPLIYFRYKEECVNVCEELNKTANESI